MGKRKVNWEERPEMVFIKVQNLNKRGMLSLLEMGIGVLMGFFLSRLLISDGSKEKRISGKRRISGNDFRTGETPKREWAKEKISPKEALEDPFFFLGLKKEILENTPIENIPNSYQEKVVPAPEDYSPEAAAKDGCFALVEGEVFANEEALRSFAVHGKAGEPANLRIVNYYEELGDVALITDVFYDGTLFHYFHDETRLGNQRQQTWKQTFSYLHVVEEGELYYLSNKKEMTYEEYKRSLIMPEEKGAFEQATIYWGKPSFELYAAI